MSEMFDNQRFNMHVLPTIHKFINELALKLKSVALRLRKGKRQQKEIRNSKLKPGVSDLLNADLNSVADNKMVQKNADNEEADDSVNEKDTKNNATILMADCVGYRQLLIRTLKLISYVYRSSDIAYENPNYVMENGSIDFLLLKKISVPLIDQLFNLYHSFGNKFLFISRRKKVSNEMRQVMSHSTIAMNFIFRIIFEISPCALITVLFMYIQNDDYAKSCCSILRDHLIPYVTKCSRLRHEQLVYEMRLRQMIIDKDYMQLFDILRLDIERVIYRKFSLSYNINSNLKSLYVTKFHTYKRNTKSIHYFESEEAVQLVSKKGTNSTIIVFMKGMCVFVFDVIELNDVNLEEKNWEERLELFRPYLNERYQEIIKVTEIHESELDALARRSTYIYIKTCGFGLGTFFETFHKYEKKSRRVPLTSKLPRDNASLMLHDSLEKPKNQPKPLENDYDVIDQL